MSDMQLTLPIADLLVPAYAKNLTIEERFELFHQQNPWVFAALESLASDWLAHGHQRVGVKALAEIVRWQYGRRTTSPRHHATNSSFKLNNDFTSRYARLLLERHPEWANAIELRALKAA